MAILKEEYQIMKRIAAGHGKLILMFFMMAILIGVISPRPAQAASVTKHTLVAGQTKQLKKKKAVWSSKKPDVASVTETGLVTAHQKGTAMIIAKVGKKKYKYKIKVQSPRLNDSSIDLELNKTTTLKVQGTSMKFKFTSSDPSIVRVKKKKTNKAKLTALKDGYAYVYASYKGVTLSCLVKAGNGGVMPAATEPFTLYYNGRAIQTLNPTRTADAIVASSFGPYGQSAPLYTSANGGDGLENIYAETNNGNVNVPGVQLSADAVQATIAKACKWAELVCNNDAYHGYDDGQVHEIDCWGIPKSNSPGTGDYCCFSLAECAYYFAGVNLLGECLGNPSAATYPPYSTMLFESGGVSFWGDTQPWAVSPRESEHIFTKAGFSSIGPQATYQCGDVVCSFSGGQQHMELVLQPGDAKNCIVAEASGPGQGGRKGGDQSGSELYIRYNGFAYGQSKVKYVYRFTGAGVVLNTAGMIG